MASNILAQLRVLVDAEVGPLKRQMNELSQTMNGMSKKMDKAARRFNKSFDEMGKRSVHLRETFNKLARIAQTMFAGYAVNRLVTFSREIVSINDSLKLLNQRIKIFSGYQGGFAQAYQSAKYLGIETEKVAFGMGRIIAYGADLGVTVKEAEKLTTVFNQLALLSGASTKESQAAFIQFTQALSANRLSGEELRSIREQAPLVAKAIADYMGITVGEIKKVAEQGLITTDVMRNALLGAARDVAEQFSQVPETLERQTARLKNAWELAVTGLDNILMQSEMWKFINSTLTRAFEDFGRQFGDLEYLPTEDLEAIISQFNRLADAQERIAQGSREQPWFLGSWRVGQGDKWTEITDIAEKLGIPRLVGPFEFELFGITWKIPEKAKLRAVDLLPSIFGIKAAAKKLIQEAYPEVADYSQEELRKQRMRAFEAEARLRGRGGKGVGPADVKLGALPVTGREQEQRLDEFRAKQAQEKTRALQDAIIEAKKQYAELEAQFKSLVAQAERLDVEPLKWTFDIKDIELAPTLEALGEEMDKIREKTAGFRQKLKDVGDTVTESVMTPIERYNAEIERLVFLKRAGYISTETLARAVKKEADEFRAADPAMKEAVELLQEMTEELEAARTPYEELAADITRYQDALTRGALSPEGYNKLVLHAAQKLKDSFEETTDEISEFAKQAARNIQDAFSNWLFDPFEDGLRGMLKGFVDTIRKMIAELAAQNILEGFFGGEKGIEGKLKPLLDAFKIPTKKPEAKKEPSAPTAVESRASMPAGVGVRPPLPEGEVAMERPPLTKEEAAVEAAKMVEGFKRSAEVGSAAAARTTEAVVASGRGVEAAIRESAQMAASIARQQCQCVGGEIGGMADILPTIAPQAASTEAIRVSIPDIQIPEIPQPVVNIPEFPVQPAPVVKPQIVVPPQPAPVVKVDVPEAPASRLPQGMWTQEERSRPKTWDGFPAAKTSQGEFQTRYTATVTEEPLNQGRPTNVPTVWEGKVLTELEAIKRAVEYSERTGNEWPSFDSIKEAEKAARTLSDQAGKPGGPAVTQPPMPPINIPAPDLEIQIPTFKVEDGAVLVKDTDTDVGVSRAVESSGEGVESTLVDTAATTQEAIARSAKNIGKDIAAGANQITNVLSLLKGQQQGQNWGQLIVTAIGAATSGSSDPSVAGARAKGGPVEPGKTFLVGEEGPELFQPKTRGEIIPHAESMDMLKKKERGKRVKIDGARARGGPVVPGKTYLVGEAGRPELFSPGASGRNVPAGGGALTISPTYNIDARGATQELAKQLPNILAAHAKQTVELARRAINDDVSRGAFGRM